MSETGSSFAACAGPAAADRQTPAAAPPRPSSHAISSYGYIPRVQIGGTVGKDDASIRAEDDEGRGAAA